MSSQGDGLAHWDRVALELRACKEAQQKAWGDIDSATLGRYLAGETSGAERQRVETALEELPELRLLTDLVRDVLADLPPLPEQEPVAEPTVASAPEPTLLPLRLGGGRWRRPVAPRVRRYAALAAAACVLLASLATLPSLESARQARSVELPAVGLASRGMPGPAASGLAMNGPEASADRPTDPPPPPAAARKTGTPPTLVAQASRDSSRAERVRGGSPAFAATQARQGLHYHSRGDLDKAATALALAHRVYANNLGPDHQVTRRTAAELAGVYEKALNAPMPTPELQGATAKISAVAPPQARKGDLRPRDSEAGHDQARRVLRERITAQSARDVQHRVVPVLIHAFENAKTIEQRRALAQALASLGSAARPAVPLLTARLQQSHDPIEVRTILEALHEMGPAARPALPVLARLTQHPEPELRFPATADKRKPMLKLSKAEQSLCQDVVRSAHVGVCDRSGLFSVRALRQATLALRQFAGRSKIHVLIEATGSEALACPCCLGDLGPRGVLVRIDPRIPTVEVEASPELIRAGFQPEMLRDRLLQPLRDRAFDRALRDGVDFVLQLDSTPKTN